MSRSPEQAAEYAVEAIAMARTMRRLAAGRVRVAPHPTAYVLWMAGREDGFRLEDVADGIQVASRGMIPAPVALAVLRALDGAPTGRLSEQSYIRAYSAAIQAVRIEIARISAAVDAYDDACDRGEDPLERDDVAPGETIVARVERDGSYSDIKRVHPHRRGGAS